MTELTPRDFENMLDAEGNINTAGLSKNQKKILALVDMIKLAGGANVKTECPVCKGSRRQAPGSPLACSFCNGDGFR